MRTLKISSILQVDRQRKDHSPKELAELKRSIASKKGLLHAPVVIEVDDTFRLIAGGRRLQALSELHTEGLEIFYDGELIPEGETPYTTLTELSEIEMAEAELEENLCRCDLSWQEETLAKKKLYDLRLASNPNQTYTDTAKELLEKTQATSSWSKTGEGSLEGERKAVAESIIVAQHLDDPAVQRARSRREAMRVILDKAENKAKAQHVLGNLNKRMAGDHQIIKGDCLVELKKLPDNIVDTIICDPPYGMNADKMGKGEFHLYDDSPDTALEICHAIFTEGFRIAKPKAILFMFCDIDHFVSLRAFAQRQAWSVWRFPLVWIKGEDGHSPWGRAGFIRTTELLLFAVKGQKELVYPGGPDHLNFKRPSRVDRIHAAEKPLDLLERLIHISTMPGMTILDPTAGSGSIIPAANRKHCKVIAIEKDETYYEQCLQRLGEGEPTNDTANNPTDVSASILSD